MTFHVIYVVLSILGFIPAAVFLVLFLMGARQTWRKRRTAVAGVVIAGMTFCITVLLGRNLWLIATSPIEVMEARYAFRGWIDLVISSTMLLVVNIVMYSLLYLYWHVRRYNGGKPPRT